jgi:hypothetical protein
MSKKVHFNKPSTTYTTYGGDVYDRSTNYTSNYDPVESSPRTSYNTYSNTADYPRSNRGYVATYSTWGGQYTSSNSSYGGYTGSTSYGGSGSSYSNSTSYSGSGGGYSNSSGGYSNSTSYSNSSGGYSNSSGGYGGSGSYKY